MRILYVTPHYAPDVNAPAIRTAALVKQWVADGHEVVVLTGIPTRAPAEDTRAYSSGAMVYRERGERYEIIRTRFVPHTSTNGLNRLLSYASFGVTTPLFGLPLIGRVDCVVGSSPHIFAALVGCGVARRQGVPFILELRDLWSQAIQSLGGVMRSATASVIEQVERMLYRCASQIVVVTPGARGHLIEQGISPDKIAVVPHGVEISLYPDDIAAARNERRSRGTDSFVSGYLGNHGQAQRLEVLLEAAQSMRDEERFRFLFAGSGPVKEALQTTAQALGMQNVSFIAPSSHEKAPELWRSLDVCLVPLADTPALRHAVPSKLLEAMVSETPIVCAASPEANQMVKEIGAGICVEPENPAAIARAIRHLHEHPDQARAMGERGRAFVQTQRSSRKIALQFLDVLESACHELRLRPGITSA